MYRKIIPRCSIFVCGVQEDQRAIDAFPFLAQLSVFDFHVVHHF
jgi:hypothetical protein